MTVVKRYTTEVFVEKAVGVHGDRYNYDKVEYVNNRVSVDIICPVHGVFKQKPRNHLAGSGCPECGKLSRYANGFGVGYDYDKFISESKAVHGDKYGYDKVIYKTSQDMVIITCPTHGDFEQRPNNHLAGQGCRKCFVDSETYDNNIFIAKAELVHGKLYDYSLVNYVSSKTKVKILCNKHGVFRQRPNSHLSGYGCPICRNGRKEVNYGKKVNKRRIRS